MRILSTLHKRGNRWNIASIAVLMGLIVLVVSTASQYGESYDEDIRYREGEKKFSYYQHLLSGEFADAREISSQRDKYPGFHDLNLAILRRVSPLSDRITGNLFSAAFGLMTIIGTGCMANKIGGFRLAFLAILFLSTLPAFYGHIFINPKDIPFACGYIWALYFINSWFTENGFPSWKITLYTGLTIGIITATRVGGLVVYCYLGLFVMLNALSMITLGKQDQLVEIRPLVFKLCLRLGVVSAIGIVILLLYWPYGQMAPFTKTGETIEAISAFSWSMPVFFEGAFHQVTNLPFYYILKMLFIKVPVLTLVAFLAGSGIVLNECRLSLQQGKIQPLGKLIVLFAVLFPLAYVILRDSTLYNGIRHLIFILPPLCILAAYAMDRFFCYLARKHSQLVLPVSSAFVAVILLVVLNMIRLHPYQYIYYNELAGGTATASQQYETDYWCTVYKELGEEFVNYLQTERPQFTKPEVVVNMEHATWLLTPFIPENTSLPIRVLRSSPQKDDYYVSSTSWAADQFYRGKPVLEVERMGVVLGVVKDRRLLSPGKGHFFIERHPMRFLIEAHHPGDIHFWKFPIEKLIDRGHDILMVSRDRDVMRQLVESCDWIPHVIPKRYSQRNKFPLVEFMSRQLTIAYAIHRYKPDVAASLFGSYCQSAWLMRVPNIIFTDSEFQHFNHFIAHPFASEIHTPYCFYKNLGSKQRFYRGIHELSFLDGRNWVPDKDKLAAYPSLKPQQYIIIRLSSWNTFHDINEQGMGSCVLEFIEAFKQRFQVVISAEEQSVPAELRPYAIEFAPDDFHHLLAFARFVLTEGASTASEAACLGIPTVYINSTEPRGYLEMLQESYGLVRNFRDSTEGIHAAVEWLNTISENDLSSFQTARLELIHDHRDVTAYVVRALEAAGESHSNAID